MRKDFDLEYEVQSAIIRQKDAILAETKEAMKKLIKMMRYPRLVNLLNRQLNFERVEVVIGQPQTD